MRTIAECVFVSSAGQAVVRYTFPKQDGYIDIHIRLITAAKNTMFKYALDTVLDGGMLLGKTAYGLDDLRQNGQECVAQEYVLLQTEESALSVANTGTYAYARLLRASAGRPADFAAGSLSRAQRSGREAVLFPDAGVFCRGAPEEDQYRGAFVESDTDGGLLLPAPERPKTPAGLFAG